jgi:hypothetical protein
VNITAIFLMLTAPEKMLSKVVSMVFAFSNLYAFENFAV